MKKFYLLSLSILCLNAIRAYAQSLPVGSVGLEDFYRREQLLGNLDSSISFTSRPFFPSIVLNTGNKLSTDSLFTRSNKRKVAAHIRFDGNHGRFDLLPFSWYQQFNSHHPSDLNDGAVVPARGYQTVISGGIFAKYGPVSVQLKPELVYAANKNYEGFSDKQSDKIWNDYYHLYLNKVDLPERFGDKSFREIYWGQSSLRITVRSVSLGLSTENLWWGPGVNNSLIMTNNAPGFKHITLNTVKPIRSFIGSFEGQIIAGRLEHSGYLPPDTGRVYLGMKDYVVKPNDWRYINAAVITYQPKWIPGLFLGLSRSFVIYEKNLGKGFTDLLPIFSAFEKVNSAGGEFAEDARKRDQLSSVFSRWIFPKEHAEIYFEYGRNDHAYNLRDLTLEPDHSRAYVVGLTKVFPLNKIQDKVIQVNLELTQLEKNTGTTGRPAESWYSHYQVSDGYTNRGQLLGSGIGPGSNMQSFDIRLNNQLNAIGLKMERVVRNNDFHYQAIKDIRAHWVDMGLSLFAQKRFKSMLLNGKLQGIKSLNYQHLYEPVGAAGFWTRGKNTYNIQAQLGINYVF